MDCPFFVWKGGHFSATLVAPWFLKETYKLDPLWIWFFVLYKIDKWAQIDSTLVGFLAMECQWTCIGWLLIGLGHSQGLAQYTFGPHRCPRASPNSQKWQNSKAKKSVKKKEKIGKFFFKFFWFSMS